tara:strand:+ start:5175 stop:5651 length:477 start_codon:yes stop_codon:yes gene_type:complete
MKINILKNFSLDKVKTMGLAAGAFGFFFLIMLFSIRAYPTIKPSQISTFKMTNFFILFPLMLAGVMFLLFIYNNKKMFKDGETKTRFMYAIGVILALFIFFSNLRYYLILITIMVLVFLVYAIYVIFGTVIGEGMNKVYELASKMTESGEKQTNDEQS